MIRDNLPIIAEWYQHQTPKQSDQVFRHGLLELVLKLDVAVARLLQAIGHLEAGGVDEANHIKIQLAVRQERALTVVLGHYYEFERPLEVHEIEVCNGDATKTIEPARVQFDSLAEPMDGTVILLQLHVADGETVDKNVVIW